MRRVSYLLGILLIVSMLLAACGTEETSTSTPNTDVTPVTAEATMTDEVTTTETVEGGDLTTTPAVPVTGEDSVSRVSNLLDLDIWNQNNEQIGEVEDMVLDMDNSNITYVIIETGGFLDIGDKTVLIPWKSLDLQTTAEGAAETAFILTADAEMVTNAPGVDLDSVLPAVGETVDDWDTDIRNFWESGVIPEATEPATTDATPTANVGAAPDATATPAVASGDTGANQGQGLGQDKLQGVMLASELLGSTITIGNQSGSMSAGAGEATVMPEATIDPGLATAAPEATIDPALATVAPEATTDAGTGTSTENQGPTDATIDDVIVDPETGEVLFLVLNTLFDDGERWIPVPLSTLRWDETNESFLFVANDNALLNAPSFQADQWPDTMMDGWDTDFNDFWQDNVTTTP